MTLHSGEKTHITPKRHGKSTVPSNPVVVTQDGTIVGESLQYAAHVVTQDGRLEHYFKRTGVEWICRCGVRRDSHGGDLA